MLKFSVKFSVRSIFHVLNATIEDERFTNVFSNEGA